MWDFPLARGFEGSFLLNVWDILLELTLSSISAWEKGTLGQGGVLAELCWTANVTLSIFVNNLELLGLFRCG
jgi:hypothetical protein